VEDRFVPSTEELLHWIHYGTEGCVCVICCKMRRLSDQDNESQNLQAL